jgi:hypothetical protein
LNFKIISVNSTCSTGSKYDVDLLRADVGHCKARVQRLKRELANIDAEVSLKQKGVDTLARVKDKYSEEYIGLTIGMFQYAQSAHATIFSVLTKPLATLKFLLIIPYRYVSIVKGCVIYN